MEVLQAAIAVYVSELNKFSSLGQEAMVLCPDGKVYSMLILLMCLAMDHSETEKQCLKAANGCLSCDCPPDEFDDITGTPRTPMLVEHVIGEIRSASARFLNADGTIKLRCKAAVAEWEKQHKIRLHWNNWFDVSCPGFLSFSYLALIAAFDWLGQYRILGERFQLYSSIVWCLMHQASIGLFGKHIVRAIIYLLETTLRNDMYVRDGNYIISKATIEAIFKRLSARLLEFHSTSAGFELSTKYVAHFRRVYTEGGQPFTAGRIDLLMLALIFVMRDLIRPELTVIQKAIDNGTVDRDPDTDELPDYPSDPCPDIINSLACYLDWYCLARASLFPVDMAPELQRRYLVLKKALMDAYPEKSGEANKWKFPKVHGMEHRASENMVFASSINTDSNTFESGHKNMVKDLSGNSNGKDQFMIISKYHDRNAVLSQLKAANARNMRFEAHGKESDSESSSDSASDDEDVDNGASRPCEMAAKLPLWDMTYNLKSLHQEIFAMGPKGKGLQRMMVTALKSQKHPCTEKCPALKYLSVQLGLFAYQFLASELGLEGIQAAERDTDRVLQTCLVADRDMCNIFTVGGVAIRSDCNGGTVRVRARPLCTFHGKHLQVCPY
jgi:hypothetical protein